MQDTTTLPISPTAFWIIVILATIAFAVLLAALSGGRRERSASDSAWSRLMTRVGLGGMPEALALFISLFWLVLALTLAGGILTTIYNVPAAFDAVTLDAENTALRWTLITLTALTGALGAVVALPFTLVRIRQTQRQTDLQDEALFNDKINAAATDLAARRQVTRIAKKEDNEPVLNDGIEVVLTEWEDDLVTRAAAIDRLEGLALERDDVAPRIARMLSIYVQELSRAHPAKENPKDIWDRETNGSEHSPPKTPEDIFAEFHLKEEDTTPAAVGIWARRLRPVRTDMERAVQSLGRINPPDKDARADFNPENIDLRHCNLQGFDLSRLNFRGCQLDEAHMQGANLRRAHLQEAELPRARMQRVDLFKAKMEGVNLNGARMLGTQLSKADMKWAVLSFTYLQGAHLSGTQMHGADLEAAQLQGARLRGAEMQGADLTWAEMQGADLRWAEMSEDTELTTATLRGAAVWSADDTTMAQLRAHDDWDEIFHPDDDLSFEGFFDQWHAFAAALDPPVTIARDYNRSD